ncbi:tumor necrosis factor receptor superfamily member 5-like isoform X2 [Gouania willdenowi]|nr:tumor necrosis factor receptor superfamily member 5-like isoform X2 [Gouania willdenowi]
MDCCPKCPVGNRVKSDCSESSSTSCLPCVGGTFLPNPSGLKMCFTCKTCDPGSGLRTKRACTAKSDSVCEPMDGFHCIDFTEGSCAAAEKHNSNCQPGYYISHQGNTFTDTECSPCRNGTYSDGSFMSCLPHTKCEDMDLLLVKPGNTSADSECNKPRNRIITIVVSSMTVLLVVATLICRALSEVQRCSDSDHLSSPKAEPGVSDSGPLDTAKPSYTLLIKLTRLYDAIIAVITVTAEVENSFDLFIKRQVEKMSIRFGGNNNIHGELRPHLLTLFQVHKVN